MRILEAFGEPITRGGQEAFVFGIIERLDGYEIDCLTPYSCENRYYEELTANKGGSVYQFGLPFRPGKRRANIKKPFRKHLSKFEYDVVHIHSGSISVLAIMAAEANKAGVKKVIVHSHCTGERDSYKHKVLRYLASLSMARHVDIYCACSMAAAEWKFTKKYAQCTRIIKNGIDTSLFCYDHQKRVEIRRKFGFSDTTFVLGTACRFTRQKNLSFLMEVYAKIAEKKSNSSLILVGDGEERSELERLAKNKGLLEKVIFVGSVSNVEVYLQAMDVFVAPSLYEGFCIAGLEALATGLPVVVSDRVPRDLEISDRVLFLSLENGAEAWAEKIMALSFANRQEGAAIVEQEGFDIRKTMEEIRDMYGTQ